MNKNRQTQLIHAPRQAPQYISTVQPPIYRASTIIFNNTDALFNRHWTDDYDYSYGTHGTPTTFTLGDNIAQIEGGKYSLSRKALLNKDSAPQADQKPVED